MENDDLNTYTQLTSNGKFSGARGGENLFVDLIVKGFVDEGFTGTEEAVNTVVNDWFGDLYLELKNDAWNRLLDYYNSLN